MANKPVVPPAGYSFTDFSTSYPDQQQPGSELDGEYEQLRQTDREIIAWAEGVIADDGRLAADSVHPEALDENTMLLIQSGWNPRGDWTTATLYKGSDSVLGPDDYTYVCTVEHTSGVFNDDLAAGYWTAVATSPETTAYTRDWLTSNDAAEGRSKLDAPGLSVANLFDLGAVGGDPIEMIGTGNIRHKFWNKAAPTTMQRWAWAINNQGQVTLQRLDDAGVFVGDDMVHGLGEGWQFGTPTGGAPADRGHVNVEQLRVSNRALVNGALVGVFAPSATTITLPNILDVTGVPFYQGVKIYVPHFQLAASGGFVEMQLLYGPSTIESGSVYFHHRAESEASAVNYYGNSVGGDSATPLLTVDAFNFNTGWADLTLQLNHINTGVFIARWEINGVGEVSGVRRRVTGWTQMGTGGQVYTGLRINSGFNVLSGTAEVTYQRTL